MKKTWTRASALAMVGGTANGKNLLIKDGVRGLQACGALDFLVKNEGFNVIYTKS